ncbi:Glutamate-1-semialdehyde 2,1-aminomutase [Caulifigura coniformis]|uniref:Glutamate-1-semialdehyde 2,1-aminomutase n=1 Tax=Caulifigura coniformis TaxID=2527983 RepID=A0A517SH46_9PLAN|nr:glutamate-1-semialdehyde 2,1-aminomutase [Caulifigura coniformis]QDT55443.1 Glutamate-1-semialdehyde 2,1-aminomutase [Caulifigura coniformis]
MSRAASKAAFELAQTLIPGGVNSPARAFGGVGGHPSYIRRGEGAYLYDIDGNQLIDYVGSWGPHIVGHRHPAVIAAIQSALETGTSFGAPTEIETELARMVVDAVPSIEKVRMVNSGTEATMSAIRVARGFTGRSLIVKFAGCYHGHVDSLLVQAGSGALTHGHPSSPGVPEGCTADTIVLEYNDIDQLTALFETRGKELAAIILEPVVGNMGLVIPKEGFLQACRDLCTKSGTVLIFDEVMTGFRLAYGGAQERFGITPDMTTLGKIIGGGLPVGAYGGRSDIMAVVSPAGPVYQAGTLSGNPLAMASGIATLQQLKDAALYQRLETVTRRLVDGLVSAAKEAGIPAVGPRCGSMFTLFFQAGPVNNLTDAKRSDTTRFSKFFHALLEAGVYLPCSQFEACFVSAAHSDADIDATIAAAKSAFGKLA